VTPRVVTLALAALALAAPAIAHAAQPNVLLIVTDDQRWNTLQYMPTVQNKLQAKGVTFTNAFAVNPVCCPSRSSILTGRWSHSTGVWGINGAYGGQ
jgi:arylsulfatase A-like enzyme